MILCDAQKLVWDANFGMILGDQMIS